MVFERCFNCFACTASNWWRIVILGIVFVVCVVSLAGKFGGVDDIGSWLGLREFGDVFVCGVVGSVVAVT